MIALRCIAISSLMLSAVAGYLWSCSRRRIGCVVNKGAICSMVSVGVLCIASLVPFSMNHGQSRESSETGTNETHRERVDSVKRLLPIGDRAGDAN